MAANRIVPVDLTQPGAIGPGGNLAFPQAPGAPKAEKKTEQEAKPTPPALPETPQQTPDGNDVPVHRCVNCGWHSKDNPSEPSPSDVSEFKRCVWSGDTFTKTVELFDGAVQVKYQALTADEDESVRANVIADAAQGKFVGTPEQVWIQSTSRRFDYQLAFGVSYARVGKEEYRPVTGGLYDRYMGLVKFFKSAAVYQAVRNQFGKFLAVLETIEARALEPSFSPATASAGNSPESPVASVKA